MAQATAFTDLYKFEQVVETAVVAELTSRSLPSAIRAQDVNDLVLPRTIVEYQSGSADDSYALRTSDSEPFNRSWHGRIAIEVVTQRSNTTQHAAHHGYISTVRWALQDLAAINARLTYHAIRSCLEEGTTRTIIADSDADVTRMTFAIRLCINDDAYPEDD